MAGRLIVFCCTWMISTLGCAGAQEPIDVKVWPDDVPCSILRKNPDGSIETTAPIRRFFSVHPHMKYKNTRETRYWDRKCDFDTPAAQTGGAPVGTNPGGVPRWLLYAAAAWVCAGGALALLVWSRRKNG